MKFLRPWLPIILVFTLAGNAGAACPPRVLTRLGKAAASERDAIVRYWKTVASGSEVEQGLIVALEKTGEQGTTKLNGILAVFPEPRPHLERIARLKDKPRIEKEISDLGGGLSSINDVKGAAAELRYADEVIGPANVAEFQVAIPGGVPDIVDAIGNFHEVKFRAWDIPEPIVRFDLQRISGQALNAADHAATLGKHYSLAFEVPVPPEFRGIFDEVFAELKARPNVTIVDAGF